MHRHTAPLRPLVRLGGFPLWPNAGGNWLYVPVSVSRPQQTMHADEQVFQAGLGNDSRDQPRALLCCRDQRHRAAGRIVQRVRVQALGVAYDACALLQHTPQQLAGPGTGLDANGVQHKAAVIARALALHAANLNDPLEILRRLGGFEIAALAAAYISCAQRGITVLVDGYITTAAALIAVRINPEISPWLIYSHRSAEPGHILMLNALQAETLLELGMRLGEGSGAGMAVPLLRLACALHNEMATFAEASVSEKI